MTLERALARLRSLPLATRILAVNAAAGVLVMVIAVGILIALERHAALAEVDSSTRAEARLIGETVAAAVMFGDRPTAEETLASARNRSGLLGIWVFSDDGRLFVTAADGPVAPPAADEPDGMRLEGAEARVKHTIRVKGTVIGTVITRSSLAPMHAHLLRSGLVAGGTILAAFGVLLGLLAWLLPRILQPLQRLRRVMDEITTHGDFAMRAPEDSGAEIGDLARVFNGMLGQIDERNASLERELGERRRAEERLAYIANHDAVTGLPNRNHFNEAIAQLVRRGSAERKRVALMFLDLDNFKMINDTLGHDVGDRLLAAVAERLPQRLRDTDLVCRLGGDEFAVVLYDVNSDDEALAAAAKLLEAMFEPFQVGDRQIHSGTSIGLALSTPGKADAEQLLRNADVAMYRAKSQGRGQVALYHAGMDASVQRHVLLEKDLRAALDQAELEIHYQPQIDAVRGYPVAFDASLHWRHPRLGVIPQDELTAIAEESGQVAALGQWALRTACTDCALWQSADLHGVGVSVGVTARQLAHPEFVLLVADALRTSGLPPDRLELELKEAAVLSRSAKVIAGTLSRLHALGVRLTLDAFGTGQSSFTHLRRLPISFLKMDSTFVQGLPDDADANTIASGILALASGLGIKTTAEGVTTPGQARFLADRGCARLQGALFSPPLPLPDLLATLQTSYPLAAA